MTIKYEALVGHLFVVGGRPVNAPPPGARVQVPPRRVHRSREQDTLFVLITPAGQHNAKAGFFEDMAALACDTYFKSRLGITGALRESAAALNAFVQKTNDQQASNLRAGAIFLVKRNEEVYLMRAGTTMVAAQRKQGYETFPLDPDMLNMLPLGTRSEPSLEFTHYTLSPGDLFLLGDADVAALSDDVLKEALRPGNIEDVLDKIEAGIDRQVFASVIQFVDSDAPQQAVVMPAAAPPVESSPEATPAIFSNDDMEETNASPLSGADEPVETVSISDSETNEFVSDDSDPASVFAPPASPVIDDSQLNEDTQVGMPTTRLESEDIAPSVESPVSDDATTRTAVLPDAQTKISGDETVVKTEKRKRPRQGFIRLFLIAILVAISSVLRSISNGISAVLDRLLPEPDENKHPSELVPMNLVALVVVIVPIVVVIVVVGVATSNRDSSLFEVRREEARQAEADALRLEASNEASPRDKRNAWNDVLVSAQRALNEYSASTEMRELVLDAQNNINTYDRIIPTEVTMLRQFEPNANLVGPILSAGGQDIYTLDRNRGQVFRDTLDGNGLNVINSREFPIIEQGLTISQRIVANLVDIEWIVNPGALEQNALIALDEAGLLISYNPALDSNSALQLAVPPEWSRPAAIALWSVNMYVLDAGADQIWRYVPENGIFQNLPEEYFAGNNRPELSAAVDFGIEEGGDLFILFNDGTISRYEGGDPVAFEINEASAPVNGIANGVALYVNNIRDYALYLASPGNDTVYKISLGGTVRGGYRPTDLLSNAFDSTSGVYDDPLRGNIYILSGDALYHAQRIVD